MRCGGEREEYDMCGEKERKNKRKEREKRESGGKIRKERRNITQQEECIFS